MRRQIKIITACLIGGLFFAGMYAIKAPLPSSVPQEVLQKAGEIHVAVPQPVTKEPKKQDMPEQKESSIKVVASGKGLVINEGEVGIKSGDKELVVLQEVAEISPAIKSFLELGQKGERVLDLSAGVPEARLEQIVDLMKRYHDLLITTIAGEIPDLTKLLSESGVEQRDAVPLIKAFHFLRVKPLIALLMFTYGRREELRICGRQVAEHFKVAGLPEFIQGDIDKMTFSIRELIEFGQVPRPRRSGDSCILDLSCKKIANLDGLKKIKGLQNVNWLILSYNYLSYLPVETFQELNNLRKIDLSSNLLSSLSEKIFQGLQNLEDLDINCNKLRVVPEGLLQGLANLDEFHCSNNQLTSLPRGLFQGLRRLRFLGISNNHLSNLPKGVFQDLQNLWSLSLRYNYLNILPAEIFQGLLNIKELYLLGNPITTIEPGVLADLPDNLESFNATYKGKEYESIQDLREKVLQERIGLVRRFLRFVTGGYSEYYTDLYI